MPDARRPWAGLRPCLLCLDLQRRSGDTPAADENDRLDRCRQLLGHARAARWPLVHAMRLTGHADPAPLRGLEPMPRETVLFRQGPSAFSHRRMSELALDAATDGLVILGLSLDAACVATAMRGHELGLRVSLVEDTLAADPLEGVAAETARAVLLGVASPYVGRLTAAQLMVSASSSDQLHVAND